MADYSDHCPRCFSKYPDIHGVIYPEGYTGYSGVQCENDWHKGPDYKPQILKLTEEDRKFLHEQMIAVD